MTGVLQNTPLASLLWLLERRGDEHFSTYHTHHFIYTDSYHFGNFFCEEIQEVDRWIITTI